MRLDRHPALVMAAALIALSGVAPAADWPMWRCDARRSATTSQELPGDLHLEWVRELPPLEPAWPDEPRMQFDATYEPVVAGKTIFVASPQSDSITAFSTDSGETEWTFYADGPVRFAPVVWKGLLRIR